MSFRYPIVRSRRFTLNQLSGSNPSRSQATPCVLAFPGAGQFDHSLTFGSEAPEFFGRVHWSLSPRRAPENAEPQLRFRGLAAFFIMARDDWSASMLRK
jgi:hypothetical protein